MLPWRYVTKMGSGLQRNVLKIMHGRVQTLSQLSCARTGGRLQNGFIVIFMEEFVVTQNAQMSTVTMSCGVATNYGNTVILI